VRSVRVWARLLGAERMVVDGVVLEGDGLIISVHPGRGAGHRCGICQRRSPRFDAGEGRRRWWALDLGSSMTFLEADAPRVRCREHGVVVSAVPGRDTAPAAPEPSLTRPPGWRPRSARPRSWS
jgi:transposase